MALCFEAGHEIVRLPFKEINGFQIPVMRWGILFFLLISGGVVAAQDYAQIEKEAIELGDKGNYTRSLELSQTLHRVFPEYITSNTLVAFNLVNLGRPKEARNYITAGLQIDPTNFSILIDAGYVSALEGDTEGAKNYFLQSIKFFPKELEAQTVMDELKQIGKISSDPAVFNNLATWYWQMHQARTERYPTSVEVNTELEKAVRIGPQETRKVAVDYARRYNDLSMPEMALYTYTQASIWLQSYDYLSDALDMAQVAHDQYSKKGYRNNHFIASLFLNEVIRKYSAVGNDERAVQYLDDVLSHVDKLTVHTYDLAALTALSASFDRLEKNNDARKLATYAYQLAEKNSHLYGMALAANAVCAAYTSSQAPADISITVSYGEKALELASRFNLKELTPNILNNLALGYWKLGPQGRDKCMAMYRGLIDEAKKDRRYGDAAIYLNNIGVMYYWYNDFEQAVRLFEESAQMAEAVGSVVSTADKLTFYQSQVSAYQYLTACYANLKNAEMAFLSMEKSRSRVLSERLASGKVIPMVTITTLQEMLKPDEACIMYSLFSGHEVSILIVTKKYSQVIFHKDDTFIGDIKDKYFDRMNAEHRERKGLEPGKKYDRDSRVQEADFDKVTQLTRKFFERPGMADDVLNEYLRGYSKFLILPINNRLSGIKSLIISPDDVLNFVPFEALRTFDGKYLVEKYSIRYMHSTGTLKQIESRTYPDSRKPLLAMGGAVYQPMNIDAPELKSLADLTQLQAEVEENGKTNKSQRKAYAALFGVGPMNPLPGTFTEVQNISKVVPSADVFTGAEMTEARIKKLSTSQQLKQYKMVHLATHGFVVNEIPDLSGVAMSIFPTEQEGEDGFLNVNEIAALQLNSDLAILSACQTALGKIYSGEGVTGLTQSLILAGSNAALVSLWPVNDTSTMLFMSNFYKEVSKGKPYPQVVNELKRKFIKGEFGEEFKHPNFWAPFIYYGK